MDRKSNLSRLVILAFVLLASAGCVMQGESAPSTEFYVLGALPEATPVLAGAPKSHPVVLDLASVRLPQYLQRTQIVTRVDANRLLFSEFEQWGGNLEKNVSRVLAANLAKLLATSEVHIAARRTPGGVDAQVEVDVMQFERGPDGRAVLIAQWRVLDQVQERTLVSRITRLQGHPPGATDTMADTVAAMSELLAELSRQIARATLSVVQRS